MRVYRRDVQQDIRELGALLGNVITTQESNDAFETVETLRQSSIDNRENTREWSAVSGIVEDVGEEDTLVVARAFTNYFELINLCEERERIRALREQVQAGMLDDGLEEMAAALTTVDKEVAQQVLDDVLILPTFTAHPTEARRNTVKAKLRSIASHLEQLDEQLLTDKEQAQIEQAIRAEVTSLWQSHQTRDRPPEPLDEAKNVQWYLENVLFDVVSTLYAELEAALSEQAEDIEISKILEFRSWAGSDRDGNPYVTPEVTTQTLARHRTVVINHYRDQLKELSNVLSQDSREISLSDGVKAALETDREQLPSVAAEAEDKYPKQPYRQMLELMRERLTRVQDPRTGGYTDADSFQADLKRLDADLRANEAHLIADTHVKPLVRTVNTFGFTLASLDLRDHREKHTATLTEVFDRQGVDYDGMTEDERVRFLTHAIKSDESLLDLSDTTGLSETAERILTRFDALSDWQREYGVDAIDTYCISMCEEPSHVLEVLFLASEAGVTDLPDYSGLDIVPLLETESALSGARRIMGTLFENEAYSDVLAARDDVQEIMLGYSDSNKENGYLGARWSLYRNQKRLATICDDFGVEMRLFHGRGGSISRGGGPMNDAMLALPNETVTGQIKFTEQGEAIAEKYAEPTIAERELEQMVNAQVRSRLNAIDQPVEPVEEEWITAMETAANAARTAYRDLLSADGFVQYFEQATPISVIEDLNLGSRPASRSGERTVEDLRAIPWVFSWTQSRCILPGWYSLATGLNAYLNDEGDIETLQEMYEQWPFFRTLLDNAALALARTDMDIAAQYAQLANPELQERFFGEISHEYEAAVDIVKNITGEESLLGGGWLQESLNRRNPYVDPLNLLQIRLLSQADRSELEERALRVSVKGIAAGMKNTG
ncbi:phosphoenolpyruvate carboxylase [Haloferax sulfurifontis]|uniref:phosphoenolpyruvate carboxylase n=1 Tax=Haloferax sulfurifontis TaxID=255616 RepID=A0A830EER2_9EURY|nr:phosphoenolpyruvate carboxylase [Haloferax sulfurifontis]GGC70472.1 phosphoenolpyruvate carboxylase [Haloferax sulfurifontis]